MKKRIVAYRNAKTSTTYFQKTLENKQKNLKQN